MKRSTKKLFLLAVVLILTGTSQAQRVNFEKGYAGFRYAGNTYAPHNFCSDNGVAMRLGLDLSSCGFHVRAVGDISNEGYNSFGGFWWSHDVDSLTVNVGYMATAATAWMRGHPITAFGFFEPAPTRVISGSKPGFNAKLNTTTGSVLHAGLYYGNGDTLTYNVGVNQNIGWWFLKSVKLTTHYSEHKSVTGKNVGGFAGKLSTDYVSLMFFKERKPNDTEVESILFSANLSESYPRLPDFYVGTIKEKIAGKGYVYTTINVGAFTNTPIKTLWDEKLRIECINCIEYSFPEIGKRSLNIYTQLSLVY